MKVRIKFAKEGAMKFIGHLDIMRYFQKAVKRAGIEAAYSEGFSPHMIMSFASPLGVGVTSRGEYFDLEIKTPMPSREMKERLNRAMTEGVEVLSVKKVPDGKAGKAMSLVAAADYRVSFRKRPDFQGELRELTESFMAQPEILVQKKTKKSEAIVDLKPCIYEMREEEDSIFLSLAAGSVQNTKPELVLEAFCGFCGIQLEPFALMVHREELYADLGTEEERRLVSLEDLGEEIE